MFIVYHLHVEAILFMTYILIIIYQILLQIFFIKKVYLCRFRNFFF